MITRRTPRPQRASQRGRYWSVGAAFWTGCGRFCLAGGGALEPGNADRLLGWSYVELGPLRIRTPSYFLLEREGPIAHVPSHRWPGA